MECTLPPRIVQVCLDSFLLTAKRKNDSQSEEELTMTTIIRPPKGSVPSFGSFCKPTTFLKPR